MNFSYNTAPLIDSSSVRAKILRHCLAFLVFALPMLVGGCSGGDIVATPAKTSGSASNNSGTTLYLNVSKTSVLSDNVDTSTITATVVKGSVPQQNFAVSFSTTAGLINSASATTDSEGKASVTFKSGPRATNQIVNITASSLGTSASVPLQITGNKISMTVPQASMGLRTSQTLTAKIEDAKPLGISSAPVTFTVLSGGNVVSISSTRETSDFNGQTQITVTSGATAGTAIIQASSLGATSQITISVAAPAQLFEITQPTVSPASMATTDSLTFTVNAPTQANVTFHTTVGAWGNGSDTMTVPVAAGVASATLTSTDTGAADITVADAANLATKDTFQVLIYAPASQAATMTLSASQSNIDTSSTDPLIAKNSLTLTATVRTAPTATQLSGGVVGNAQVSFTLTNQPGGGEKVSPGIVTTDSSGTATTTFTSGTLESGSNGITVTATVIGTGVSTSTAIVIKHLPGSIVMGRANKIIPSTDNTSYQQVITIQATGSGGNPASNAVVSLKLWPTYYYLGAQVFDATGSCVGYGKNRWPACTGNYARPNEDANMNLALDPGEDVGPYDMIVGTMMPDGLLTPHNAAAGSVPATILTDADGKASFMITYLKQYSMWVQVSLQASVTVQGTENQSVMDWELEPTKEDYDACQLFPSPFGYYAEVCPGNINVTVKDAVTSNLIANATATADGLSCNTDANGNCTIIGVSGGTQTIVVTALDYNNASTTVNVGTATVSTEVLLQPSTGSIKATVYDASKGPQLGPISGALVSCTSGQECTTGAFGTCTITAVPVGAQSIIASATGFTNSAILDLTVVANTVSNGTLSLTPAP